MTEEQRQVTGLESMWRQQDDKRRPKKMINYAQPVKAKGETATETLPISTIMGGIHVRQQNNGR